MGISFAKLEAVMKSKGKGISALKTDKVISGQTYSNLRAGGEVNTSTIAAICAYLNVQPGEIMEYVPIDARVPD